MDWDKILDELSKKRNFQDKITAIKPTSSSSSIVSYDFASLYPSPIQSYGRYNRRSINRKVKIKKILNKLD